MVKKSRGKERSTEDQARYDKLGEKLALNELGRPRLLKVQVNPMNVLESLRLAELEAYIDYRRRKEVSK